MKIHNDFTLYWRVFPSGKRVVYYYAYDKDGKRQMGRSTGETNMTAARVKCNQLLKENRLIHDDTAGAPHLGNSVAVTGLGAKASRRIRPPGARPLAGPGAFFLNCCYHMAPRRLAS